MSLEKLRQLETEEIRILQEERLRIYEPHPTQEKFHKSQAKIRGFFGGNQVGKTTAGVVEACWQAGKVHPYRKNFSGQVWGRVCMQDFKVLNTTTIPKFKQIIPRKPCKVNGLPFCGLRDGSWAKAWSEKDSTLYLEDGSFIEFRTYEQDVQSHAGPQRHFILFDEEPPRQINEENFARQTTVGINAMYTMTPLNYSQWLYRGLFQRAATDPGVEVFTAATKENKFVDAETLAFLEETYTDPAERAARLYGKFTFMAGLVYKEYGDHNLIDPWNIPQDDVSYSIVIDPHEQKATAWNMFAEDWNGDLYCIAEGDEEGDVEQICNQIFSQYDGRRMDLELVDPSARRKARIRGHDESMLDEFRKYIPNLIEANNTVDLGISRVRAAIKPRPGSYPKFRVSKNCPITDHQMRNLSFKAPLKTGEDRTKPAISLMQNDHPDCVRYRINHQPIHGGTSMEDFNIGVYGNPSHV